MIPEDELLESMKLQIEKMEGVVMDLSLRRGRLCVPAFCLEYKFNWERHTDNLYQAAVYHLNYLKGEYSKIV